MGFVYFGWCDVGIGCLMIVLRWKCDGCIKVKVSFWWTYIPGGGGVMSIQLHDFELSGGLCNVDLGSSTENNAKTMPSSRYQMQVQVMRRYS